MPRIRINGKNYEYDGDGDMPLLWYLREVLDLKGTKYGCGIGECGACMVHVDGEASESCMTPMSAVPGKEIRTIEGVANGNELHPVQEAWIKENVSQCGYCQPGQIMATIAYLRRNPEPSDRDIDENLTNICRCGTYNRIRKAIHRAATSLEEKR